MNFSPLGPSPLSGTTMRRFDELRNRDDFLSLLVAVATGSTPTPDLYPWSHAPVIIAVQGEKVLMRRDTAGRVVPVEFEADQLNLHTLREKTSTPQTHASVIYSGELAPSEDLASSVGVLAIIGDHEQLFTAPTYAEFHRAPTASSLTEVGANPTFVHLRTFAPLSFDVQPYNRIERAWGDILSATVALNNWHGRAAFDPVTGQPTRVIKSGWARATTEGREIFPRTDPAVITAVSATFDNEERILLGNAKAWGNNRFSTFAGFVEVGESLENTVERELFEEAGVLVESMQYMGSQPWPFPRSLMLGFSAVASNPREVKADGEEIAEIRWFTRDELRTACLSGEISVPQRSSISRKLIEHWMGEPLPVE